MVGVTPDEQQLAEGFLFTDQYQLTMAQLYVEQGMHDLPAQFDYTFRSYPDYGKHQAGYCVAAGLGWLLDWLDRSRPTDADLELLASHESATGERLFRQPFLDWLRTEVDFTRVSIRAIPEGRVVHPNEPIAIVEGPLAIAQILETSLLNHLNYQTLIATKASRVSEAGRGRPVLDFGLRRAPGVAGNAASRAALIGGADFTSNVGVSHVLGHPPKGTHGHSMVQVFMALGGGELEAFRKFANAYPDDCVLLVDTIDTVESGVPNAITVFEELRAAGHEPVGIRLDSGDLAYLAIQAARLLNDAGFPEPGIVLSSNLDELAIWQILRQIEDEAPSYGVDPAALLGRLSYGVGTRLVTSEGDPSLDGVYKLTAVKPDSEWVPAIKVSENPLKVPIPGAKRLWRIYDDRGLATADAVALAAEDLTTVESLELHHPNRDGVSRALARDDISAVEELLVDVWNEQG
ncbi:MAG: nicotinate phosphoribosyltransferase, partial [Acidimicrobiia bacterium]|nr:nicotinate phosphoribosyltransferase [Acidimicrobiia bacterium]